MDEESNLCLIMEYANEGDISQMIMNHIKNNVFLSCDFNLIIFCQTNFAEDFIWKTIYDIVTGLKILHSMNIVHRDLKSANLFYN